MWRAMYLAFGVMVARWVFRRQLEPDTLTRLRHMGGL
jgi:cation transporter-like permease